MSDLGLVDVLLSFAVGVMGGLLAAYGLLVLLRRTRPRHRAGRRHTLRDDLDDDTES